MRFVSKWKAFRYKTGVAGAEALNDEERAYLRGKGYPRL
jgi:hypothetical protein